MFCFGKFKPREITVLPYRQDVFFALEPKMFRFPSGQLEEGYYKIHPNKNVIESFFAVLHPTWVALS